MSDELKLLVEWSSPWEEFRSAVRPALGRSERALAGEAHLGMFPFRGMLAAWGGEVLLFLIVILLPGRLGMHTFQPPAQPKYDVIYYSGNELPRTVDAGGAESGHSGRSGGREGHHPTQAIRVARGTVARDIVVDAPKLDLPYSNTAVANLLAYKRTPGPPPAEGLKSSRPPLQAPQLQAVAPAPEMNAEKMRQQPLLNPTAVAPPPSAPQGEIAALRLPGSNAVQVVPPPVSAPEQLNNSNPRLTLPRQTVVAPPPSQVTSDLARTGPGYGPGELHSQVVPPPVQMGGVVGDRASVTGIGNARVVPPPVQMENSLGGGRATAGLGSGVASAVPPAPSLSGAGSLAGRGSGNRGGGFGGPGELGEVAAPPSGGGSASGTGVVVSNQPGSAAGVPGKGGTGALALSPNGGPVPGLGGSGGGTSIGRGNGPGSGFDGAGPGAGKTGTGYGSDPNARGGISPAPGPGGTGRGDGNPAIPGVSVSGGSNIVTLPSFNSGSNQPTDPKRSSAGLEDRRQEITVEASPRSGGAFNFYGALKGDKVYTIYLDTTLGTAVLEFSDPSSAAHPYSQDLTAPQPIRAVLPSGLRRARLVIACVVDRSGIVRNPQVLESAAPQLTAKVLAALPYWKFRPALRGNQPVEVNALLGFAIDTSDRY